MSKMPIAMAILCLPLMMWPEVASAQSTFSVSVSRHSEVPELSDPEVKDILDKASKMLQKSPGHVDTPDNFACNVTFTLKGSVGKFGSTDTPAIVDRDHIDAVHRVDS